MSRFAQALETHPAPRALGDVTLRYEPSMLIGETAKTKPGWRSKSAWLLGVSLLLLSLGALVLGADMALFAPLLVGGGTGLGGAIWLERHEKRRRCFVANFATITLRLDFTSPIAGYPRTMLVDFDDVRAVALLPQVDGASCLCVDFEREGKLLREVLAASIPEAQHAEAERLARVLVGAFGLGERPALTVEASAALKASGRAPQA
jgi:hypothetical protein